MDTSSVRYFVNFIPSQKQTTTYMCRLHEKANYLFLSYEQRQCVGNFKSIINVSKDQPTITILIGKPGSGKLLLKCSQQIIVKFFLY